MNPEKIEELKKDAETLAAALGYNVDVLSLDLINVKDAYCRGYAKCEKEMEKEIQARIEFKMEEFMSVIRNAVKFKYKQAFDMTQKSQHVWQAFEEIEQMFKKEMWMPPPYNDIDKRRMWEAKQKAVNNIAQSLQLRGHDEQHKRGIIAREVEQAQNY